MKEVGEEVGKKKDVVYLLRLHCLQPSSQGRQSLFSASATSPDENSS